MKRCVRNLFLSLIAVVFGLFMIGTPVFAVPDDNPTDEPGVITPTDDPDTPTTPTNPDDEDEDEDETTANQPTCYDEVGGIGWLICPGTGFLANVIDGAYEILETLIKVDPLPTDDDSPIHVVWEYIRNLTNLIFIILLLVVVYSQLTGFGINNYGIKRILPRLIIVALLVNLSYIICTACVDLSNILGMSLRGVFNNIQEQAIANSHISDVAANTSVAGIVATILGIGTVGTATALVFAGGVTGLLWVLIPVILSGALAIISAVITMAARQALIILLAMVAPAAFVCYLLPNTERWFQRWKQLFTAMLIFFPMFSVLYGASQLAGLAIITSADNWLSVILGIAVEILPLFMTIPLMRMSGTMLGRIDGLVHRAAMPATGRLRGYSAERQMMARQRQLNGTGRMANIPHNRLARYLEQRRVNRKVDLDEATANNMDTMITNATTRDYFNGRGQINARGVRHYQAEQRKYLNSTNRVRYAAMFDEGFGDDGTDTRIRTRDLGRVATINEGYKQAIINDSIANAYATSVKFKNMENRAETIKQGMKNSNDDIYRQVMTTFNTRGNQHEEQKAVSAVLADAITAKRRVDAEAKSNYSELYNSMEPGGYIGNELRNAFDNNDYNSMVSALQTMAMRGDHDQIGEILREKSAQINGDTVAQKMMQQELRDTLIRMKIDDADLWAWAKANMMRSAMNAGGKEISSYIDFSTFMSEGTVAGDIDMDAVQKVSANALIQGITDSSIAKSQDRTVFKDILAMQREGVIQARNGRLSTKFSIKQLRSAATSGAMDGDQLAALNALITGGYGSTKASDIQFFNDNKDAISANIVEFLAGMSASQLASAKTATIVTLNKALMEIEPGNIRDMNGRRISGLLAEALKEQSASLCRPNAVADRNKMNAEVREMLGIREINPNGPNSRPGGTQDAVPI